MAPTHKLTLTNGQNTDDLKFSMEVNGIIEKNGSGTITDNVADETKSYSFRGTITSFTVHRGAGSVDITNENGVTESFRFQDLKEYDTRNGVSGDSGSSDEDSSNEDSSDTNDSSSDDGSSNEDSSHDHSRIWSAINGLKDSIVSLGGGSDGGSSNTLSIANESPDLGVVSRPFSTQSNVELHVGDGKEFSTLQAAVNSLPHLIQHEVEIHVHGAIKNGRGGCHVGPFFMVAHVDFEIIGHNNASLDSGININVNGKLDHIQVENMTFNWVSQCKDARFENCTFRGNGRAAFSGKMGGKMLINCEVGGPDDKYAIQSIGSEHVEIRNCTLNANEAAVRGTGVSTHAFTGNNQINAPKKYTGYANEVWASGKRLD